METSNLIQWGGIAVVIILAAVLLWTSGAFQFSNPRQVLAVTPSPSPTTTPTKVPVGPPGQSTVTKTATSTPNPGPTVALPALPDITPPPNGQVYALIPTDKAAGWMRTGDEVANHLGDYNIYAGVFDDQVHLGAIQFDISQVGPGAPIVYAELILFGLTDEWLGGEADWSAQLLESWLDEAWSKRTFADLAPDESVVAELEPVLTSSDLEPGEANAFSFGPEALAALELRTLTGQASFRIKGPTTGSNNLFSWDSGYGTGSRGWKPVLRIVAGPAPDTPPSTPTPHYIIITSTPTPENIVTRAVMAATATAQVTATGTATPLPANWVTPAIIVPTATPANAATAQWQAAEATAQASLYGTPTPWPPNVWTATPEPTGFVVVVTNTPTPASPAEAVAWAKAEATLRATAGTPTPFPPYVITATPQQVLVTSTPTPQNQATAEVIRAQATIVALRSGTRTPTPQNWVTPTPTPTPTPEPLLIPVEQLTPTATPTGLPTPHPIPASFDNKIAFISDRLGEPRLFIMDPDGSNVALLTQSFPYDQTAAQETIAPDGQRRAIVRPDASGRLQIVVYDAYHQSTSEVTRMTGLTYDPVWAPTGERIAFVSTQPGNDEIYTINADGTDLRRLTANTWEWDKHPSWSPNGIQIVFYSNRYTGRRQIWLMNADGTKQMNISNNEYEDWDPVWIK